MANRTFNRKQALEKEIKDIYLEAAYTALVQASGTLNLTADIVLTKVAGGASNNGATLTTEVLAAAANPTDTVLVDVTGTAAATVITVTPNDGTNNPTTAATGTLNLTADIILTDNPNTGVLRNTTTLTTEVLAAAANPTDTVLIDFTGTAAAIVCTVTPNDGTNNSATPVDLTTAELVEAINTGAVVGKNITITDLSSLRTLQTATGGDATALADSGEGDSVVATFSGGANSAVDLTTAELVELINTGAVSGKTITLTDAGSLRNDQTATGGDTTVLVDAGEGDHVIATFAGGVNQAWTLIANQLRWGVASLSEVAAGEHRIVLSDKYISLKFFKGVVVASTAADQAFQVKAEDVNGAVPYVDFFINTGATPTNPADGSIVKINLELKNSSAL